MKGGQLNTRGLSSVKEENEFNALMNHAFRQKTQKGCVVKKIKKMIYNFHEKYDFSISPLFEEPILTIYFKHSIRLLFLYNITNQSPNDLNCGEIAELLSIVFNIEPKILTIIEKNLENAVEELQYEAIADENVIKEVTEFLKELKTCIKFSDKNVVSIRFENINTLLGLHEQISKDSMSDDELKKIRNNVAKFLNALQIEKEELTTYVNALKNKCENKKRNSNSPLKKSATTVLPQKNRKSTRKS